MKTFFFKGLLQNKGWHEDVYVSIDSGGKITEISDNFAGDFDSLNVYALPGFQNAHSHAFQYAMAGLAESHSTQQTPDDFWSWRDAMYKLALTISPDHLEAIAKQLYAEMLRHGYTNVAEFHYVHHDRDGKQYANISEMGERLIAAAAAVGIGITLIPIFYQKGGFGYPAQEGQKRFISKTIEEYYTLLEATQKSCEHYVHANSALGIHSMRAVEPNDIVEVAKNGPQKIPFHIHISEQSKEIEDSIKYLGKRPVDWLLSRVELNERFHLVHATHLGDTEVEYLARSRANVVLCPSTEGNLGDGIFPLRQYQQFGGNWSIGTDSHVGINPMEELRILDYGQRLNSHKRNTFYDKQEGDGGKFAFDMALKSGRLAMGNYETSYFEIGAYLDAVLIDANYALIESTSIDRICSTVLFSSDVRMQWGTFSKGKLIVSEGRHNLEEEIKKEFISTIHLIGNRR